MGTSWGTRWGLAHAGPDRGSVTVEGAIALCSLLVVFGLVLAGVVAVSDQLRCAGAAREAARLVARGERPLAAEAVRTLAPDGATFEVRDEGRTISVTVRAGPAGGLLPALRVRAQVYAELEPGVDSSPAGESGIGHAPP